MTGRDRNAGSTERRGPAARIGGYLLVAVGLALFLAGGAVGSVAVTVGLALAGLSLFAIGLTLARAPWYLEEPIGLLLRLLP